MLPAGESVRRRRSFLRSLRTALNVAAALGVAPYSLRGRQVVLSVWRLPYHIFSASILPFIGAYALIFPNPLFVHIFFAVIVFFLQYVFYIFSIVVYTICNIVYRRELASVARQLLKIERMFLLLNVEVKISYMFWSGILEVILIMSCSAGHIIICRNTTLSFLAFCLTFHFGNLFFFAEENLILFFLNSIQHYLDLLVRQASSRNAPLVQLCSIHDRLADVTATVMKLYALPVLFLVLAAFIYINCNIFIAYRTKDDPVQPIIFCWVFLVSLLIFKISNACGRIKEKGNQFHKILYNIVKKDKSWNLLNNTHIRAHLLKKKSFSFNIAGFSEVDLKFISGMISATVTYAVILIQIGDGNY